MDVQRNVDPSSKNLGDRSHDRFHDRARNHNRHQPHNGGQHLVFMDGRIAKPDQVALPLSLVARTSDRF